MTVALWCILIAIFLPYVCTVVAKISGGFRIKDNHDPRDFMESLNGLGRRAHAAQLNSFEVTPAFAAAVIVAHLAGNAELVTINVLSVVFITSRLLYIICYLADWAILRSLVWFVGMGLIVSLFVVSA
ncbi:MAG: MAPEG family protein [Pseudomonadota bacterium]|nr:MAPEG family protein [Pseudomonadota bacterium]